MKKQYYLKKTLFGIFLAVICLYGSNLSADEIKSTSDQRKKVELTIYNHNLGLVKDTREISIPKGIQKLSFMDVASSIQPETVHIKSNNNPENLDILEQNYDYDLISRRKLLEKYVGKEIKLISYDKDNNPERTVKAKILSNNGNPVYEINGEIYLDFPGTHILPSIPENLISRPTLIWVLNNKKKNIHEIETTYLTSSISWKTDYVMVLNDKDTICDLSGWVTIDNKSGAEYENAHIKLIAGDVHRAPKKSISVLRAAAMPMDERSFAQEAFFEYHLYTLQRKTTLKNNQNKQIKLINTFNIPVKKEYIVMSRQNYFISRYRQGRNSQDVEVYIKFKNSENSNLGIPLPAGTVRVYKEDSEKSLQFIGEDSIKHTPKDETVKIKTGNAFDIVCERTQVDYTKLYTNTYETEWKVVLRNHKKSDVTVQVIEPMTGDWEVLSYSHKYKKTDAFTLKFDIKVPAEGMVKLNYRVKVKY